MQAIDRLSQFTFGVWVCSALSANPDAFIHSVLVQLCIACTGETCGRHDSTCWPSVTVLLYGTMLHTQALAVRSFNHAALLSCSVQAF